MSKSVKSYYEKYENVSLRKFANATGINYGILLKKSKEPIPGEVYDAAAINYDAIDAILARKEINVDEIEWEQLNIPTQRKGASLCKDMNMFEVGTKVWLRKNNTTPYEVVYKTETHIVLMLEGTSEPSALSHNTFLLMGPSFEPRAIETKEVED